MKEICRDLSFRGKKILEATILKVMWTQVSTEPVPPQYSIAEFMRFASKEIKETDRVLDAGADTCPYKKYFAHAHYESTDIKDTMDEAHKHTFICSLDNIPKEDSTYDAIINTQVLEHVGYPQTVIKEFYRILKPGGKLFLTAPQGWGVHAEPYNFFNFTKFGLELLFKEAGFKIIFVKPRGGMFVDVAIRLRVLPSYIVRQYILQKHIGKNGNRALNYLAFILLFPFYLISIPFADLIIPLICRYLDKLDKTQDWTLGYSCYCIKDGNK